MQRKIIVVELLELRFDLRNFFGRRGVLSAPLQVGNFLTVLVGQALLSFVLVEEHVFAALFHLEPI